MATFPVILEKETWMDEDQKACIHKQNYEEDGLAKGGRSKDYWLKGNSACYKELLSEEDIWEYGKMLKQACFLLEK